MHHNAFKATLGLLIALIVSLSFCGCDNSKPQTSEHKALPSIKWNLASSYIPSLDLIYQPALTLSERVSELSNGRFQIHVYASGELIPGLEVFDAVQQGTVAIGHTASYYYIGKHPAFAFQTSIPFGLTARQHTAWMLYGGGLELMQSLYDPFNIKVFPGGNTGVQMGGWFNKPIESVKDLKGLKMRIPGLGGKIMQALGVNVQVLAGGDIYAALDRGAIDATEWVGPYDDEKLGFHEAAKYYYYPGWWEPGPELAFLINQDKWDALPDLYKSILKTAAKEAHMEMLAAYDVHNPDALDRLIKAGVKVQPFPESVMLEAMQTTERLMDEQAAQNADYKRVYTHWKAFRSKSARWLNLAERSYTDFIIPRMADTEAPAE